MSYKWVGAVLVIAACGGFGVSLAAGHRRQVPQGGGGNPGTSAGDFPGPFPGA